jgi:peptidoglycan hydrolase CwlO-like protein
MKRFVKNHRFLIIWFFVVPIFAWQQISFWQNMTRKVSAADTATETLSQEEIDSTKNDISDLENKLKKEQKARALLQQNLGKIQSAVSSTQKAINTTKSTIAETASTISRKEAEVANLSSKIELQKNILRGLLRQVYYNQGQPLLNVVLSSKNFADIFSGSDNLLTVEDKISKISLEIAQNKSKIEEDKAVLALEKQKHEEILDTKVDQKQELVADQIDVQGDIQTKDQIISRLNKEIGELQGDLNKVLGKSYNAKDIKDAVEFASEKTGVPKGFLFGMLKMETNLGANVGGCTYGEVESGAQASYKAKKLGSRAWATFLVRRDTFKGICKELDLDYQKQKVSCNPRGYTGTGGAMGVAQFMPDTWNAYKSQVKSITGNSPASPWNLTDGVTAMALKLSRVPGVTAGKTSAMKSAACSYLGTCYAPYVNGILYWAENYKSLL